MKKPFIGLLFGSFLILSACSSEDAIIDQEAETTTIEAEKSDTTEVEEEDNSTVEANEIDSLVSEISDSEIAIESNSMHSIEYEVPESWRKEVAHENLIYYYPEDGMLMVSFEENTGDIFEGEMIEEFIEGYLSSSEAAELLSQSEVMINDNRAFIFQTRQIILDEQFGTNVVLMNTSSGFVSIVMGKFLNSDKDYTTDFKEILNSIIITDNVVSDESETAFETVDNEFYFDGIDLITEDYIITITDYKVIKQGEEGNEYGGNPVIAFWYDITVSEDATSTEYNPTMPWMMSFEAVQDNDPNIVNKLSISSHPDSAYLDTQLMTIKPGGTVTNAVAYELTDLETPVTLNAIGNLFTNELLGSQDYNIK